MKRRKVVGPVVTMVHRPGCADPSQARAVCACGANVVCGSCGWGKGQWPCECQTVIARVWRTT